MKRIPDRGKALAYAEKLFQGDVTLPSGKTAWHFGRVELHMLLDFIYGVDPAKKDVIARRLALAKLSDKEAEALGFNKVTGEPINKDK